MAGLGGGFQNDVYADLGVIGGGRDNAAYGAETVVVGGRGNVADGFNSFNRRAESK